jgi:hypothetical protein
MVNQDTNNELTPKLRYERINPTDLHFIDAEPIWTYPAENIDESILALLDEEWRTDHIKAELLRLNFQPVERSRQALGEQLVSEFINPERISTGLQSLSPDAYTYYLYRLLMQSMVYKFTTPVNLETILPQSVSPRLASKQILKAGLVILTESGRFYAPEATLRALPPSHIPFPIVPKPVEFIPAEAPRNILLHIQQIIGLFDEQTFTLRDRLRWNASDYAYYSHLHCWPPHPDDAKKLIAGHSRIQKVSLMPPEPQLDEQSLRFWVNNLGVSADIAEFYYHLFMQSAILHAGSPVRINQTLVQEWLALPAGRQIVILYDLYRSLSTWAVWWPAWRNEQIDIQWDYQGHWGLTRVDATLLSTNRNLQELLLDILSFLPQDEWLGVNAVVNWIVTIFPDATSHQHSRGLSISGVTDGWQGWLRFVLTRIIAGPLHYFGFADVAPSLDQVHVFRLHHLQDVHWKRVTDLDIGAPGIVDENALHFDPASQVLQIPIPAPPDFLSMIQLWSKLDGLKGKTLHYYLDVERLHQAFEQGNTPSDLCAAWEHCSGYEAPESLQAWWNHWWRNYGHIRLYSPQAVLITRDTFTMKEVQLAIPRLEESIHSMVTPTAAVIKSEDADKVVAELERQGYMPKKD